MKSPYDSYPDSRSREAAVRQWSDGVRTSAEISHLTGIAPRRVRKIQQRLDLPRPNEGAQPGQKNHQYVSGRRIHRTGYAYITHPKTGKSIPEHRYVMECKLGRELLPGEVVDHIDGLTLHNAPENLRLFASNGQHLAETARGPRHWSAAGRKNIGRKPVLGQALIPVSRHKQMLKAGDVRLIQILRAALRLGIDSPYLSGTPLHTKKAGIDMSSRQTIEHALASLYSKWELPHVL